MNKSNVSKISGILKKYKEELFEAWIKEQLNAIDIKKNLIDKEELEKQSRQFLHLLQTALEAPAAENFNSEAWQDIRQLLSQLSAVRLQQGFSPSETATFIFSFKQPLFQKIRQEFSQESDTLADETWRASLLLDKLGLYTMETYQKSRENVIKRQQEEMLELTTPVIKLWENILALPLIGTLDSARTQIVMENLLQKIVDTNCEIAVIDITGVPNVDTLVAQHLLKTVTAARLMGAECVISGIRPQIAQTIVHLGVSLEGVVTKASLADAFIYALKRVGQTLRTEIIENKKG